MNSAIYSISRLGSFSYIGLTNDFDRRKKQHKARSRYSKLPLYCWMRKHPDYEMNILQSFQQITLHDLEQCEIYWIKYFKDLGCRLLNCTDGGGLVNPSQEVRDKISRAKKKLYAEDPTKNPSCGRIDNRRRGFYCSNGQFYQHTREAAKPLGIDRSMIMNVLKKRQKIAKGLTFSYDKNDPVLLWTIEDMERIRFEGYSSGHLKRKQLQILTCKS